jgi:cytochrome b6-f complex iron-sulfur subunit
MPEPDDPKAREENGGMNRRRFVRTGTTSLAIAGAGACVFGFRYLSPNVLYEPSPVINVGKPEHYRVGSVTLDGKNGIFVVRETKGFYALSAVCTHLGCLTVYKAETGEIACPCHGSTFRRDGTTVGGPAPKGLPWLKMWLADDGNLQVDRSSAVDARAEYVPA